MKSLIVFLFILVSAQMAKADDWLCTQEASHRMGDTVKSCGIGVGADESDARSAALLNAKKEFYAVCEASNDCTGHAVTAQPMRTTCNTSAFGMVTCYRLVNFVIAPYSTHSQEQPSLANN